MPSREPISISLVRMSSERSFTERNEAKKKENAGIYFSQKRRPERKGECSREIKEKKIEILSNFWHSGDKSMLSVFNNAHLNKFLTFFWQTHPHWISFFIE
ncbi:hypothetical protein CEXT_355911 [Caerostris extrusa]|uniref:Uncharacterized protein n=1 Tax=Caerostris extrusa TaxID=172846 RepID=A0AAV4MH87_CAEEX|nr:hypothetical protein CEXT_355911 [Caerostris extrusa]